MTSATTSSREAWTYAPQERADGRHGEGSREAATRFVVPSSAWTSSFVSQRAAVTSQEPHVQLSSQVSSAQTSTQPRAPVPSSTNGVETYQGLHTSHEQSMAHSRHDSHDAQQGSWPNGDLTRHETQRRQQVGDESSRNRHRSDSSRDRAERGDIAGNSTSPNWALFGRQLSQIAGDMSTSVRQNEHIISLLDRLVTLAEITAPLHARHQTSLAQQGSPSATTGEDSGHPNGEPHTSPSVASSHDRGHVRTRSGWYEGNSPQTSRREPDARREYPAEPQDSAFQSPPRASSASHSQHSRTRSETISALMNAYHGTSSGSPAHLSSRAPRAPQQNGDDSASQAVQNNNGISNHRDEVDHGSMPSQQLLAAFQPLQQDKESIVIPNSVFPDVAHEDHQDEYDLVPATSPEQRSADADNAIKSNTAEDRNETGLGNEAWKDWLTPQAAPITRLRNQPQARYKNIRDVRQERKQKTKRSLATIGRIPLKEYLELKTAADYRSVRRLARTVYAEWLEQNVRLAKQDPKRVQACIHRIEHDFPILANCDGHWKAKELMQQVTDNAIDEVALHRRKQEKQAADGESERTGDISITTAVGKKRSSETAGLQASPQAPQQWARTEDAAAEIDLRRGNEWSVPTNSHAIQGSRGGIRNHQRNSGSYQSSMNAVSSRIALAYREAIPYSNLKLGRGNN